MGPDRGGSCRGGAWPGGAQTAVLRSESNAGLGPDGWSREADWGQGKCPASPSRTDLFPTGPPLCPVSQVGDLASPRPLSHAVSHQVLPA